MERCAVKPYKGNEKYVFVSYSRKDKQAAYPIIEQMVKDGYRVWFDEGLDSGSEWVETVAKRINDCAAYVALISNRAVNSHTCRQEINFAVKKRKQFLSVMLEKVESMSLGMEMLLSARMVINKDTLENDGEFFGKLYETGLLKECRGPITITIPEPKEPEKKATCYLIYEKNKEVINLPAPELTLGRSGSMSNYVIHDNSTVGRCHAKIKCDGNSGSIVDNSSTNGTFINGHRLEENKEYLLKDNDRIMLSNEVFTFHVRQE